MSKVKKLMSRAAVGSCVNGRDADGVLKDKVVSHAPSVLAGQVDKGEAEGREGDLDDQNSQTSDVTSEKEISVKKRIDAPETNDVLFGRGKPYQNHCGNARLHNMVDLHRDLYLRSKRFDKCIIAKQIVRAIKRDSGRFLKRGGNNQQGNFWVEVSDSVAREKVSHALRSKVRREKCEKLASSAAMVGGKGPASLTAGSFGHTMHQPVDRRMLEAAASQSKPATMMAPPFGTMPSLYRETRMQDIAHYHNTNRSSLLLNYHHQLPSRGGAMSTDIPPTYISNISNANLLPDMMGFNSSYLLQRNILSQSLAAQSSTGGMDVSGMVQPNYNPNQRQPVGSNVNLALEMMRRRQGL